jgi:MSHA biogenesis protein MshN
MSLINQMLKDLDARHEGDTRGRLHREVRALPETKENRGLRLAIIALLTLTFGAAAWWGFERFAASSAGRALLSAEPLAAAPVPAVPVEVPAAQVVPALAPSAVSATSAEPPAAPIPTEPPVAAMPVTTEVLPLDAVALDAASGLKLSALLDKLPSSEPPATKAAPAAKSSSVSAASAKRELAPPAPRGTPAPAPQGKPVVAGGVDKTPVARSVRERADGDYRRAVSLVNGGRVQEATDVLLDVLRQDGGHVASRQLLARLLIEQRRSDEAMAILAEGLSSLPGQLSWAMTLARLQVDRGDLAAAARTLQQSLPFAVGSADYQGFAGHVQHRLGRHKESIEFYQAAVRIAPSEGRWWLGLGLALEADHRSPEAREAFQRARASGTLNADLLAVVDQKLR